MRKLLLMWVLMMAVVGICYGSDIVNVTFEPDRTVRLGETFNVTVEIESPSNVSIVEIELNYNENISQLIDITPIGSGSTANQTVIDMNEKKILLIWYSNYPRGTFNLANITFRTEGVGTTDITSLFIRITAENGSTLIPNITSATVNVIAPDLRVEDMALGLPPNTPPHEIISQIDTIVRVTITNDGNANSGSFRVNLSADNGTDIVLIGSQIVSGLNAGEDRILNFTWTPESAGQITLRAVVDANNNITESNEFNNIMERTVTVSPEKPIIIDVSPSTQKTYLGETFTVNITLKNMERRRSIQEIHGVLTYDPRIITCINITFYDVSDDTGNINYVNNFSVGRLTINITNQNINVSDITIAQVTFKVMDNGTSDIELENIRINDTRGRSFNNIDSRPVNVTVEPKIKLKKGWNPISVPYMATLSSSKYLYIVYFNESGEWEVVDFNYTDGCYKYKIKPLYGYYIYCNENEFNIDVIFDIGKIGKDGHKIPPMRKVIEGWNLVGVSPATNDIGGVRLDDFIRPIRWSCAFIIRIYNETGIMYDYNPRVDSNVRLYPYEAYWIYCIRDDTLGGRGWEYKYYKYYEYE